MSTIIKAMMMLLRCVVYSRVSTDDQAEKEFSSLEVQEQRCIDYIRSRREDGWVMGEVFRESGRSGKNTNRPELRRLLHEVRKGNVKVVIATAMDRLARNLADQVMLDAIFRKHGVTVYTLREGAKGTSAVEGFTRNVIAAAAELELGLTTERIREKVVARAEKGLWKGGNPPYGYTYDVQQHLLIPHVTEAPVLRSIFTDLAGGRDIAEIVRDLRERDVRKRPSKKRLPTGEHTASIGRLIDSDDIREWVKSPTYRGFSRVRNPDALTDDPNNPTFWREIKGNWEPMVSVEIWEAANAALTAPRKHIPRLTERDRNGSILKGLLVCGCCGYGMTPARNNKVASDGGFHRYYQCINKIKEASRSMCSVRSIPAAAEGAVLEILAQLAAHPDILVATLGAVAGNRTDDIEACTQRLSVVRKELSVHQRQLANIANAIKSGGFAAIIDELKAGLDETVGHRNELIREETELTAKLASLRGDGPSRAQIETGLRELTKFLPKLPIEKQKELLQLIIKQIIVRRTTPPVGAPRSKSKKPRYFDFEFGVYLANIVQDVMGHMGASNSADGLARFTVPIEFPFNAPLGTFRILDPRFRASQHLGKPPAVDAKSSVPNAIARALMWNRRLRANDAPTASELAKSEKVSPATVSLHLRIMRLPADFLGEFAECNDRELLSELSLRKLLALVDLPPARLAKRLQVLREMKRGAAK